MIAEEQVEERRLVRQLLALAQDDRVFVVAVHLDRRIVGVGPSRLSVDPVDRQVARRAAVHEVDHAVIVGRDVRGGLLAGGRTSSREILRHQLCRGEEVGCD